MVIDTSAIADDVRLIAAPTLVEATLVAEAKAGDNAGRELDLLLDRLRATVVDCTEEHALIARSAWRRFGRGKHRAVLSYGDCFSYAAAKYFGEPLLFKGDDFTLTDVAAVVEQPR